jgi:uncharacterized damage-inducible protein DinB
MKLLIAALFVTSVVSAQETPANPLVTVSKNVFGIAKNDILRSADKIPEDLWAFQPTPEVRTIGQLFAHVADGQYEFCGVAAEGHPVSKGIEKTYKTKADIVRALKEAFAYCDATYARMTDANAPELVNFLGMRMTKLGAMDFNTAHTMEHYGNLVTYMRLKGIVPPSSEPRQASTSRGGSKKN